MNVIRKAITQQNCTLTQKKGKHSDEPRTGQLNKTVWPNCVLCSRKNLLALDLVITSCVELIGKLSALLTDEKECLLLIQFLIKLEALH